MSVQLGKVISLIIAERFGPVVEKIVTYLFQYGTNPLIYIKKSTELPLSKVKEALCILIKYRLVTFAPNKNENIANYTLDHQAILLMIRYPKYINLIKKQLGDECEMMVEEVLQRSYWSASKIIQKVYERRNKNVPLQQLKDHFIALVTAKYLKRLPALADDDDKPVPTVQEDEELCEDFYKIPEIDLKLLVKSSGAGEEFPDKNVYFAVNFDRFHQDMRDKVLVQAFAKKFDENAEEFVRLLLKQMYIRTDPWADISNPVPILEIRDLVRKQNSNSHLNVFFDQYVNIIEQDNGKLIRKAGEASGGSLQIHIKDAFKQFAWEVVEQIVLEKFDSKAARIFRLVKLRRYIEPDQIQKLAMIPSKDAKKLSYQLLEENFLQIQELRKAATNTGPQKSFTLFHIQLDQIVRMIIELCYKTLYNIMTRMNHEKVMNQRIIVKKHRVDTLAMGMRAQGASDEQLADIEDMITPPEREILERIDTNMKKLNNVQMEIDETIFLLEIFLQYNK